MKTMKNFALVLAYLMLASCGAETTETESTNTIAQTETIAQETELTDDLPEGLSFDGEEVVFLSTDYEMTRANTYMAREELNGEILNDALYNRNAAVSERLDAKLTFYDYHFEYGDRALMYDTVRTSVMSGAEGDYQVVLSPVYFNSAMIGDGLMTDIGAMPYVDFEKPWWFDGFNETATIYDKTWMAASDGSLAYLSCLVCMPFNEDLAENYQITDLYAMVDDGKWTLDALREIVSTMYVDLNGNGTADSEDQYGLELNGQNYAFPNLTSSQGGMITIIDGEYTYTYDNERNIAIFDKLYALYNESNNSTWSKGGFKQEERMTQPFMQNRALFDAAFLWELDYYRELDFTYGILPYPKFDEAQTEYYNCVGNAGTVFLVPVNSKGSEKVGAVLEAISSEAYKTTTPAYFEYTLQGKYSTSEDMARMIEMLRETSYMNVGDVLAEVLGGQNNFGGQAMNKSKSGTWASTAAKQKESTMASLEEFLTRIAEFE